ncbi:hypothetical protein EC99P2_00016 [Enterococcus phage EC99P2]|nr:hypothetical protein EC99P2_00016 [Enterococcus phage EC99P2]
MNRTLNKITDHPDIKLSPSELARIQRNKVAYSNVHDDIHYLDSNGEPATRPFNAVNVLKTVSRKLSKLVFNEGVTISLTNKEAQDFIADVFAANRFEQVFGEELEGGYAISGLAIVPVYDAPSQTIKFVYCSADNFIPLDGNTSVVSEAAIINHYRNVEGSNSDGQGRLIYYTLFAIHKRYGTIGELNADGSPAYGYEIIHELYRSIEPDVVGEQVSLKTIEETADLSTRVELSGLTKPLFVYIKLAGKNNVNYGSPLGLGVCDNAYRQFCNFNDVYDKYMDEVDTATRQLVASEQFFDVKFNSRGEKVSYFDPGTRVWRKLNTDDAMIEDFSPAIRAEQYISTLNFILQIIELNCGFSPGTFSFDGKSVKTATEVISENTDTYQTRSDNVLIVKQAITDLILNVFYLGSYYELYNGPDDIKITVDFDDGVFTSKTERQAFAANGKSMGLMSARTAMMRAYGFTEKEANQEYAKILEEQQQSSPEEFQKYAEDQIYGVNEFDLEEEEIEEVEE